MSDERPGTDENDRVQHVTAERYNELKRDMRRRDEDRRSLARLDGTRVADAYLRDPEPADDADDTDELSPSGRD